LFCEFLRPIFSFWFELGFVEKKGFLELFSVLFTFVFLQIFMFDIPNHPFIFDLSNIIFILLCSTFLCSIFQITLYISFIKHYFYLFVLCSSGFASHFVRVDPFQTLTVLFCTFIVI